MPRKAYPFWLMLLSLCLTLSACSQPTPTLDNQAATPTLNTATTSPTSPVITDTGLSKGTLKEIFPTLATLPEQAQTVRIWSTYGTLGLGYQVNYNFQRNQQGLKGLGLYDVQTHTANSTIEDAREITLSASQTRQFLAKLLQTPVEDGPYKGPPITTVTDSYPFLSIEIDTNQGSLHFYSSSQKPDFFPWTVTLGGRSFTASDATPFDAYKQIEANLQPNVTEEIIRRSGFFTGTAKPTVKPDAVSVLNSLKQNWKWDNSARALTFSPRGNIWAILNNIEVVTGTEKYTSTISLVENSSTHSVIKTLAVPQQNLSTLTFSPDGKYLAATIVNCCGVELSDEPIFVWEVATGRQVAQLVGHEKNVEALAFTADDHTLVSASLDRTMRVWSIPDGKNILTLQSNLPQLYGFKAVAISPDGKQIAAAGLGDYFNSDYPIKVWQMNGTNGSQAALTLKGHKAPLAYLAFSPEGQTLLSTDEQGGFYQWVANGQNWQLGNHIDNVTPMTSLSFSPASKQIATGHRDGTLRLWSATDLKLLSVTTVSKLGEQGWSALRVFFSQDGRTIFTGDTETGIFAQWNANP